MNCDQCKLYKIKSKKQLKYLLNIKDNKYFNQKYIVSQIEPYIDSQNYKKRLIEPPKIDIKNIQKAIKNQLSKIEVPDYVFSGIKGKSYVENAKYHEGNKYVLKIDLTAFFPSITRDTVYNFFKNQLLTSPDIAEILTNLTTINLDLINSESLLVINDFLDSKKIHTRNHLLSGAPTSQILSYLANFNMFSDIKRIALKEDVMMTVYVDDITFSSERKIPYNFRKKIFSIISKSGYRISRHKVKTYSKYYPKVVTGVIIAKNGSLVIKNSLRRKIIDEFNRLNDNKNDIKARNRLQGLVTAAQQVQKNAYPSIRKFAFDKNYRK